MRLEALGQFTSCSLFSVYLAVLLGNRYNLSNQGFSHYATLITMSSSCINDLHVEAKSCVNSHIAPPVLYSCETPQFHVSK